MDSNLHQPATCLLGDHYPTIQAIGADTKPLILACTIFTCYISVFLLL